MRSCFITTWVSGPMEDICHSNMVLSCGMLSTRGEEASDSCSSAEPMPGGRGTEELRNLGNLGRFQVTSARPRNRSRLAPQKEFWTTRLKRYCIDGEFATFQPLAVWTAVSSVGRTTPISKSRTDGCEGRKESFKWALCTCTGLEHAAVRVTSKLQTKRSEDAKSAVCKLQKQKLQRTKIVKEESPKSQYQKERIGGCDYQQLCFHTFNSMHILKNHQRKGWHKWQNLKEKKMFFTLSLR